MTKEELLKRLSDIESGKHRPLHYAGWCSDEEINHVAADYALLEYINDKEVFDAFNKIKKWYS